MQQKTRNLILFPPLIFIVIGMLIGCVGILFNVKFNPIILPIYLFFVFYLFIGLFIILRSDYKIKRSKFKEKYETKN